MTPDTLIIWGVALALTSITAVPMLVRLRRRERRTETDHLEALKYGLHEPVSLHPVIDPDRCIGTAGCVSVCPEGGVLGIRAGQAVAVQPARCIGHGLCERVCPMEAIQLVFGTEKRGVDLPRVRENFETNVPGLYIVGELGGMGLVANAFEQGRQCVEGIARVSEPATGDLLDLVIIGCGPAGLAASLVAVERGLRFVTLEKEDLGGTVRHYPRKKLVMTQPVKIPGYGKLPIREIQKEELIDLWQEVATSAGLQVTTGVTAKTVESVGAYRFHVVTDAGVYEARRVILAIGRRGVPRKLGVPGEDTAPHVSYSLREPEAFSGDRILVVGGGDSAVEAALGLAEQPGNEVRISYRRAAFSRIKPANQRSVETALQRGRIEVLWETTPSEIRRSSVVLSGAAQKATEVPADQVFVFIGGELPTGFLRSCGVEIETHFGAP